MSAKVILRGILHVLESETIITLPRDSLRHFSQHYPFTTDNNYILNLNTQTWINVIKMDPVTVGV